VDPAGATIYFRFEFRTEIRAIGFGQVTGLNFMPATPMVFTILFKMYPEIFWGGGFCGTNRYKRRRKKDVCKKVERDR
jgi:hypothetical protein